VKHIGRTQCILRLDLSLRGTLSTTVRVQYGVIDNDFLADVSSFYFSGARISSSAPQQMNKRATVTRLSSMTEVTKVYLEWTDYF
jgi:hypothetical protein